VSNSTPSVSIIVPAYNSEKCIVSCINSVLVQSYNDFELIVVNDGSLDRTPEIIRRFSEYDQRVKFISIPNSGVSVARQVGFEASCGDWVTFLDSDDFIDTDFIKNMISVSDESDLVVSSYTEIFDSRKIVYDVDSNYYSVLNLPLFLGNHLSSCLVRAPWGKLFKRNGFLSEMKSPLFIQNMSIGEDTVFMLNFLSMKPRIRECGSSRYYWDRRNDSSLTKSSVPDAWIDFLVIYYDMLHNLCDLEPIREKVDYDLIMKVGATVDRIASVGGDTKFNQLKRLSVFAKNSISHSSYWSDRRFWVPGVKYLIVRYSPSFSLMYHTLVLLNDSILRLRNIKKRFRSDSNPR